MEKIVEQGLLYDFYGSLLTGHQQKIYEKVVYENLSLNEVAETEGVSKQAVHDLVRRCTVIMRGKWPSRGRSPRRRPQCSSGSRKRSVKIWNPELLKAEPYERSLKPYIFRGTSIWHLTA